jgi:hypothetical protein
MKNTLESNMNKEYYLCIFTYMCKQLTRGRIIYGKRELNDFD